MPNRKKSARSANLPASSAALTRIVFLIAMVLLVGASLLWWRNVANSPRRVFYSMLNSSLKTRSVSKRILQNNGLQKLDQHMQMQTGSMALARAFSTLSQGDNVSTSVTTESIGTPDEDYVRYLSIETEQKQANGKEFDFSHVLGFWGKSEPATESGFIAGGQLFGEVTLGVVPMGEVGHNERQEILNYIRDQEVYEIDFSSVTRESENGHPRLVYNVSMSPEKYVTVLKQFGSAVGLEQLEVFDPSSFKGAPALRFKFIIDVWSRQLVGVEFIDSDRTESYSGYGAESLIIVPEDTVPVEELQSRLQTLR